jgi:hypothetical protein
MRITIEVDETKAREWIERSTTTSVEVTTVLHGLLQGSKKDTFGLYSKAGVKVLEVKEK